MFAWEVSIEGKNLLLDVGNGVEKRGLRAERHVEAWDRADAGAQALEEVELELSGRVRNAADDLPSFRITDVDAVRSASEFPEAPPEFEFLGEAELVETPFVPTLPVDENFHLARGVFLTDRGGLSEGFEVAPPEKGSDKTVLFVNVSAERTVDLFWRCATSSRCRAPSSSGSRRATRRRRSWIPRARGLSTRTRTTSPISMT